jgi:hypothetical protein
MSRSAVIAVIDSPVAQKTFIIGQLAGETADPSGSALVFAPPELGDQQASRISRHAESTVTENLHAATRYSCKSLSLSAGGDNLARSAAASGIDRSITPACAGSQIYRTKGWCK